MFVAIFSCFACVNADLSVSALKGIDQLVEAPMLSPILGFVALHSYLPNYRLYGHYGSGARGSFCGTSKYDIGELLRAKADCPLDWNAEWIQRLFPSQDGSALTYNKVESDLVSWFTPKIIALMLGMVYRHEPADDWISLTKDITFILLGMDEERVLNKQLSDVQRKIAREKKKGALSFDTTGYLLLNNQLKGLQSKLESVKGVKVSSAIRGAKEVEFDQVAELFVNAIRESREANIPTDSPKYHYPKYLPEQALLAFMVSRMTSKAELTPYLLALDDLLKDQSFLTDEGVRSHFAQDVWDERTETPTWESIQHADSSVQNPSHRERLIYRFMEDILTSAELPARLMDESATYEEGGQSVSYSDCGETSMRNFFNMILYDKTTKSLNVEILAELEKKSAELLTEYPRLQVSDEIKKFYRDHTDPRDTSVELHNEWAATVVSRKPGVHYAATLPGADTPGFGLKGEGSQKNTFTLLGHLLFDKEGRKQWFAESAEKQVEILAALFSRDGYHLEASLRHQADGEDSVALDFTVNGQPAFKWTFMVGHIYFQTYSFVYLDRMKSISTTIFTSNEFLDLIPVTPLLATCLIVPPRDIRSYFDREAGTAMNYVFSLDFSRVQDTIFLFTIMTQYVEQLLGPFAARIADKLVKSAPDKASKQSLLSTLNQLDFPFGIPASLGFMQLPLSELPLQPTAPQYFHSLIRTSIFGRTVYIGDSLDQGVAAEIPLEPSEHISVPGEDPTRLAWVKAFKFCLSLNPASEIDRVRSQLKKREEALQQLMTSPTNTCQRIFHFCKRLVTCRHTTQTGDRTPSCVPSDKTLEIREIYQRFPIRGFSLLGLEEMIELRDGDVAKWVLRNAYEFDWTARPHTSVSLSNSSRRRWTVERIRCAYSD